MSCALPSYRTNGIFGYVKDSNYTGNFGVCFNLVQASFQGVSPKWCYFTQEKYQMGKKYTISQQGKTFVFNGSIYNDPDKTVQIDSEYYCRVGTMQSNPSDIYVHQFSVNDEIWYPCKKGDVYGLYCPMRDLTNAQESDYWIYNEKFTGVEKTEETTN